MARGDWKQLGDSWERLGTVTALHDGLYAACDAAIWKIDDTGAYTQLGDDEWRTRFLIGVAGHLVAIEPDGRIYRIDPRDASYVELDGSWDGAIAACAGGDAVFVIDRAGDLYRVEPADGSYHQLGDGYEDTIGLTAAGGALVTFDAGGAMFRISAKDGSWDRVANGWAGLRAAAGDDRAAYGACGDTLYAVDVQTGDYEGLTDTTWASTHLVVRDGALLVFEPSGGLYRIEL